MIETMREWLGRAYTNALKSPDPSSQNGAILVRKFNGLCQPLVEGYNHFYKGVPDGVENRESKLQRIEHAERDVIYKAANLGIPCHNAILVCPWAACYDCARAIIGSGISELITHRNRYVLTDKRWIDQVNYALNWIQSAGIELVEFEGPVPAQPILISGRLWSPENLEYV